VFCVLNDGDVPAVSVSVRHKFCVYDKKSDQILGGGTQGFGLTDNMIFSEALAPMEHAERPLVELPQNQGQVGVYDFLVKFYRKEDMKETTVHKTYFVENGLAKESTEYIGDPLYAKIMMQLDDFQVAEQQYSPGALKTVLDASEAAKK